MSLENRSFALIEDDLIMGETLMQRLRLEGAKVHWWRTAADALAGLPQTTTDAVICDIRLPDCSGEEIFRTVARDRRTPPFLFITGYGDIDQAVKLMREGARDYLTKPFLMGDFLTRLEHVLGPVEPEGDPVLGVSATMGEAERFLRRAARVTSNLLLTGETGVGKEVCARFLHNLRQKPTGPFMAVNCAAIPTDLLESELFGHEKGAFTGAQSRHLGYAERAGQGVLFLDEVGELAPKLQAKLLRVIEDRSFHRVGGEQAIPFKARLICATNADIAASVREGRFREDLYYRINVLSLRIPPLRERVDDIEWLVDKFFPEFARCMEGNAVGVSALGYEAAREHAWPGNVRELRNRIERAVALAGGRWIMPGDLFPERSDGRGAVSNWIASLGTAREDAEKRHIQRALAMTAGAILPAAKALGIWACDHYKTTLNAHKFKQVYKKRTDIVKDAMNAVPAGDKAALVAAIVAAIKQGGLFAVDVDIVPTKIGEACHVWLPAATSGEMNLTSMNGERRMRLTERYMDPPGESVPDCLIAARLANNMERVLREVGDAKYADQFKGFDWKTEEDAFMDGYHKHEKGGQFVTYERLRAMGNNGFQEPAVEFKDGRIVGTKRLYADGKFGGKDGKATFMEAAWRGLQAPGKEEQKKKFKYLINNGRTNHVWQNAYLDQDNEFIMDRWPYPFIEMNPDDMSELKVAAGDLVEVYNDDGSTQAMVYPTPTAKKGHTFMLFAYPTGVQGNVVNAGTNELILPNYKQTWANIRRLAAAPAGVKHLSFKVQEYKAG